MMVPFLPFSLCRSSAVCPAGTLTRWTAPFPADSDLYQGSSCGEALTQHPLAPLNSPGGERNRMASTDWPVPSV